MTGNFGGLSGDGCRHGKILRAGSVRLARLGPSRAEPLKMLARGLVTWQFCSVQNVISPGYKQVLCATFFIAYKNIISPGYKQSWDELIQSIGIDSRHALHALQKVIRATVFKQPRSHRTGWKARILTDVADKVVYAHRENAILCATKLI